MDASPAPPTELSLTLRDLAKMIDHSLLHPTMTDSEIAAGIELAKKYDVATACVKPYSVPQAAKQLAGTDVKVCPSPAPFLVPSSRTLTLAPRSAR